MLVKCHLFCLLSFRFPFFHLRLLFHWPIFHGDQCLWIMLRASPHVCGDGNCRSLTEQANFVTYCGTWFISAISQSSNLFQASLDSERVVTFQALQFPCWSAPEDSRGEDVSWSTASSETCSLRPSSDLSCSHWTTSDRRHSCTHTTATWLCQPRLHHNDATARKTAHYFTHYNFQNFSRSSTMFTKVVTKSRRLKNVDALCTCYTIFVNWL